MIESDLDSSQIPDVQIDSDQVLFQVLPKQEPTKRGRPSEGSSESSQNSGKLCSVLF